MLTSLPLKMPILEVDINIHTKGQKGNIHGSLVSCRTLLLYDKVLSCHTHFKQTFSDDLVSYNFAVHMYNAPCMTKTVVHMYDKVVLH